jgi:hypothetical protein
LELENSVNKKDQSWSYVKSPCTKNAYWDKYQDILTNNFRQRYITVSDFDPGPGLGPGKSFNFDSGSSKAFIFGPDPGSSPDEALFFGPSSDFGSQNRIGTVSAHL